jgi:hypothetical protein
MESSQASSGGRCARRRSFVTRVEIDKPVIHRATLWYPTAKGPEILWGPNHQNGDAQNILGKITDIARCRAITGLITLTPFRRYSRLPSA